jgi:hypothetical protein
MRSNSKTILAAIRRVTPSAFALRAPVDRSTDLPVGRSGDGPVQPPLQKYSAFPVGANHLYKFAPSCPTEGRLAIVTNAVRDAMDADALLTNGAEADGEVVWS